MILKNPNFGIITGKLKISHRDAKNIFGFKMKKGEKYIVFRRHKDKCIICHYSSSTPKTELQIKYAETLKKLVEIYKLNPHLHKHWKKAAKGKKYGPIPAFIKYNINNIVQNGWKELKLIPEIRPHISGE